MNKIVIVLVLTTAAASLACMNLVSKLRDERVRTETLQTRVAELERAVAERDKVAGVTAVRDSPFSPVSGSPVEHEPERRTAAEPPSLPAEKKRSVAPAPDMGERMRDHFARQRKLMEDPKYREAMRKQQRVHMDGMYPGLEEALGFSADEKSRFLDLLSQQQAEEMAKASESMMWDASDAEAISKAQEAVAQRQQRYDQEMDEQFGPHVRQKWREYQETLGQRHRVAAMQSQLALAGTPLNAEQSKAVLNAFVEAERRQMGEHGKASAARARGFVAPGVASTATDWSVTDWMQTQERAHESMLSTLQASLTSEQIKHLEAIFSREREAQRASMELMRAQGVGEDNIVFATGGSFAPAVGVSMSSSSIRTERVEDPSEQ